MNKKLLFLSIPLALVFILQTSTYAHDPYIRIKKGENLFFHKINFKIDHTKPHIKVTIANLLGQTVKESKILRSLSFVPTASLLPGYYILKISSGAYTTTQRMVVTKL
ncbi:T9SS type A sorting domain-containing protein [uncultured Microscilla sp.]|uniref:T9SS type A sorting domain-containing protein n=1 Tax=uncultured Microscilla sp. TaxID=432653 RepID=UPI00261F28D2|nr:T9SS type A sorting domain-containing protein [uncultured Microscilla sp.]